MGVLIDQCAAELTELRLVSRQIHSQCRRMGNAIISTGPSNQDYEDPLLLSLKLNNEVQAIEVSNYEKNRRLYGRLLNLIKIIRDSLQDYRFISKVDTSLLWLKYGLIGGTTSEGLEFFLHDITQTLSLMSLKRSENEKQTLPAKKIEKLGHMLDRANSEQRAATDRVKEKVGKLLKLGVKDFDELVSGAFMAIAGNCPVEPTRGYVLRELITKGYRLSYDWSALSYGNGGVSDKQHKIFNRWEVSAVPISYLIPEFAILDNGDQRDVVFRSFDNQYYKIASCRWVGYENWEQWRPAPEASAIADHLTWRRFFPCYPYKRNIRYETKLLSHWYEISDENSEDHASKVDLLKHYMLELQRRGCSYISNPRTLAAKLSDLAMRDFESTKKEERLLTGWANAIRRAIIAKGSFLPNLISGSFANWIVATVSQMNLNVIGRGDLTLWNTLKESSGKKRRFNLKVRRSGGSYFEGERCDVEVIVSIPGMLRREVVHSIQHLATIYDDLPANNKEQMWKLGVFYIEKLLQTNRIVRRSVGEGTPDVGPRLYNMSMVMELDSSLKVCDVVKKREEEWDSEDLDTIPSSKFLEWGEELTSW